MALGNRVALLEAKEDLVRVIAAGAIAVTITVAAGLAISRGRLGRTRQGVAPEPPAGPGFVGCASKPIPGKPMVGDYVAVPLLDENEGFVEWGWIYVQSVNDDEKAISGVFTSSGTNQRLASERHRFHSGDQVAVLWECLGDRLRTGYNPKGEPVCGAYGSLVHEGTSTPLTVDAKPGMTVLGTVGPRSPGMVPAVDAMEAVRVKVDALSPLKVVRGRIVSETTKSAVHGYDKGDVVDLPPDCIYGALI